MLDILILNGVVITMEGKGLGIIENGAVGIKGNSIEVIGSTTEVQKEYKAHRYIDAQNKVVMPGLIDAHIHTGIGILRGLSQDVDNWMQKGLWPFARALNNEARVKGSMVNIMEGLKAGTTTFCDYDNPMLDIVKNHQKLGTRARVSETINELPENISDIKVGDIYPLDPAVGESKLKKALELINGWHQKEDGRITCLFGPQGPDMMSKELLLEIKNLAKKYKTMIHMHVAQGDREINQMEKRFGLRTIPYLDSIGYLDEDLMAVHLTEATKEETQLLAKKGASMILCSGSIGIIDGIVPPSLEFLEVSNKLALGSDQAPGNNCNNMFNEMKFTAILNKCKKRDPKTFPAWQVLRHATIEAARAIGLGNEVGSLKIGKKADIIILDFNEPALFPLINYPVRNVVPNLVYSAKGSEVETVIIHGKVIVDNKVITTVDEKKAVEEAHKAAVEICNKAGGFISLDNEMLKLMKEGLL